MASDECVFYYYDAGYSCKLKYEKEGRSSVDSDTVHRYCWGYHYNDCPLYKSYGGSSSGCFLTSACVEAKGLPDDCYELTTLRKFRDEYLAHQPGGKVEICEYYHIAPQIVESVKASGESQAVFTRLYEELVKPCVELIEAGQNEEAYIIYRETVKSLKTLYS